MHLTSLANFNSSWWGKGTKHPFTNMKLEFDIITRHWTQLANYAHIPLYLCNPLVCKTSKILCIKVILSLRRLHVNLTIKKYPYWTSQ